MCCNCCSVRQQKIWVFGLGGFLGALGLVLLSAWPSIVRQLIRDLLPLAQNSFMYKNWVTTPLPVHTSFYLFNWTNPQDLNNPNVKPNFEQLGPYTFSDYKVKEGLLWEHPEVTYYGRRTFHFLPEYSNGSLDDIVTTPNFPSVVSKHSTKVWNLRNPGSYLENLEVRFYVRMCQKVHLKIYWNSFFDQKFFRVHPCKPQPTLRLPPLMCAKLHAHFERL